MIFRISVLILGLLVLLPGGVRAADSALDFKDWGMLAIQDGGRRKPVDTFARETVVRLTGMHDIEAFGQTWQPAEFILSVLLDNKQWGQEPILLIGYRPLVEKLALDATRKRFSYMELAHSQLLNTMVGEAHAVRDDGGKPDRLHQEAEDVAGRMALFARIQKGDAFTIVPAPESPKQLWVLPPDFEKYYTQDQFAPATKELQSMVAAYVAGDAFNFSLHAHTLRGDLRGLSPVIYPSETALSVEIFSNQLHAFDWAAWSYGAGLFIFGTAAWFHLRNRIWLGLGVAAAALGLLTQVTGLGLRCYIGGRPPVTNMYESMIWVSSGVMIFALLFFIRYRTTAYLMAALPVSLSLLLVVGQMPLLLPSNIDPLVPVLRNNYWLTVHVLTITLSYAAFALAMGFGHILLFRYWRDPVRAASDAAMHFWLYRVLQLGVLLLAAGTILGGVWANYSWGRFWGWDPKETWALITLLCYLLVLHGRVAGWWRDFGLVLGSALCFNSVVMAWYGVNFVLGTGLHSYGFGVGGETYVAGAVALDLCFIAGATYRHLRRASGEPPILGTGHPAVQAG